MDDNKAPVKRPETDLSPRDMETIQKFIEDGLPGVARLDGPTLAKMLDLYLDGQTYRQISQIIRMPRELIIYASNRFKWFDLRQDYISELEFNMRHRTIESRLASQDTLLRLTQFWQKKFGKRITHYLETGNDEIANTIDPKEISIYIKTVDILHRLNEEGGTPRMPSASPIGLNLGDGVTIRKNDDNSVEITPKQKSIGEMLKQYADERREQERKDKTPPPNNDIVIETTDKGEGEEPK